MQTIKTESLILSLIQTHFDASGADNFCKPSWQKEKFRLGLVEIHDRPQENIQKISKFTNIKNKLL